MLDGESSETELLRASLRGNTNAFEAIIQRYQSLVCAITYSATANLDKSEELAHEAFIRAWTNLAQLQDLARFRAWLCTIARNVVRNYIRDKRRDVVGRAASLDRMADVSSGQSEPVEAVIDKERQAVIRRALEEIPDSYREPMILFYREQKSLKQVAEQLGLSHEAARTRVSRGRKLLREQVAAMVEDAIGRTRPGKAFTAGVLASIAGMVIKGSGVATAVSVGTAASATGSAAILKSLMSGTTARIVAAAAVAAIGVGAAVTVKHLNRTEPGSDPIKQSNEVQGEPDHGDNGAEYKQAMKQSPVAQVAASQTDTTDEAESSTTNVVEIASKDDDKSAMLSSTGVSGIVVDKQTSEPIKGAHVFSKLQSVTDANGCFELVGIEAGERQSVYVIAKGYASRRIFLAISENRVIQDMKIELVEGARIAGVVRDEKGKVVVGAKVMVSLGFTNHPVITNKDGEFEIDGLDPGLEQSSLIVTHLNYTDAWVPFTPPIAGQTVLRDVVLKAGMTVHGKVTDSKDNPVSGVVVGTTTSTSMWNTIKCKTDADGEYQLKNVPFGELVLWVRTMKHAPYVKRFSLDSQEFRKMVDIQLEDPVPLRGKIVDKNGNAVPGVRARIWEYKGVDGLSTHREYVTCDSGGRFVIPNAPETGKVTIDVYGEGISDLETELEMGLEEYVIEVDSAGTIYGKVVDDVTGEPIKKFTVKLKYSDRGSNPGYGYSSTWSRNGNNFDSAEGLFDTGKEDLPIGAEYSLTVYADGFDPLNIDPVVVPEIAEDSTRIEFRLKSATTLTGRIVDTKGVPIEGARIHILNEKTASSYDDYDSQDTKFSDSNGCFCLVGIGKRQREIYVTADSFGSHRSYIDLLPRDSGNSVKIVLAPGVHIFGRVFGLDGRVVSDARMYAYASPKEIRTDADGYYEFTDLPAGVNHVSAYLSTGFVAKRIETEPGESVELNFGDETGYTLSGMVRAGEEPIEKASVRVNLPDKTYTGSRTDDKGMFRIKGVPEGLWDVWISCGLAGEHLEETREIVVDANVELDFDLGTGMISGRIPDAMVGNDNLRIRAWRWMPKKFKGDLGVRIDWNSVGIVKIDAEGFFSCSYLTAGRYYLSMSESGEILGISDVFELTEAEHLEGVTLSTGNGRFEISVLDLETGEGVAKVDDLVIENDREAVFRLLSTDDEGKAKCSNLPPGEYIMWVQTTGYLMTRIEGISADDSEVTPVTIYMERGGVIRFEVSARVREMIAAARAILRCRITNLDTGQLVPKPVLKWTGYRRYDEHSFNFSPALTAPEIDLPEGRYEIEYRLYDMAYASRPALAEGVARVKLFRGKTSTILIADN